MNAKLCKRLRKMARQMSFNPQTDESLPDRRLMVHPAHEQRFKEQGHSKGITAVNDARSTRGIYRWLKKNDHAVA